MNHAQRLVLLIEALEGRAQTVQDLARVLGVGASLVGEDSRDFVFVLPYGGGLLSLHPPTQTREAAALEGQGVPLHVSASPRGVDRPRSALLHRLKTEGGRVYLLARKVLPGMGCEAGEARACGVEATP